MNQMNKNKQNNEIDITKFLQRPIDNSQRPLRIPITEYEFETLHAGEPPRTLSTSSSFEEEEIDEIDENEEHSKDIIINNNNKYIHDSHEEINYMDIDPHVLGATLSGEIGFLSREHFKTQKNYIREKARFESKMSGRKYRYFEDIPSDLTYENENINSDIDKEKGNIIKEKQRYKTGNIGGRTKIQEKITPSKHVKQNKGDIIKKYPKYRPKYTSSIPSFLYRKRNFKYE